MSEGVARLAGNVEEVEMSQLTAVVDQIPYEDSADDSTTSPVGGANQRRNEPSCESKTWKLRQWDVYIIIGVTIILTVAIVVISKHLTKKGSHESVSRISGKYTERVGVVAESKIDPCQDFHLFACAINGSGSANVNRTFIMSTTRETQETAIHVVKALLEEPKTNNYETRAATMAKQLYNNCMHNTSFSSFYNDLSWMRRLFLKDDNPRPNAHSNQSGNIVEKILAQMFAHDHQILFKLTVKQDEDDESTHLLSFSVDEPEKSDIVSATNSIENKHVRSQKLFESIQAVSEGKQDNSATLPPNSDEQSLGEFEEDFENLVKTSKCGEQKEYSKSGRKINTKFTLDHIQTQIPQINWAVFLQHLFDTLELERDISSKTIVEFHCFKFFKGLGNLIEETGWRIVSQHLILRFLATNLLYLDSELFISWVNSPKDVPVNEDKLKPSRWKNCVSIVKDGFGIALAYLYQQKDRKASVEKTVLEITYYLKMAFRRIIFNQVWIPSTGMNQFKNELIQKLTQMQINIGYPEHSASAKEVDSYYDGLVLNQSSFMLNVLKMRKFHAKGVFKMESSYQTLDVNAHYHPSENRIVIPVGLLNYPMLDEGYPMYLNFANLGFFLAHEMAHGFDNDGLNYDKDGHFTSWWPDNAQIAFKNKAACFAEQYGKFKIPLTNRFVDGINTLDENICDNTAFHLSFLAYEMWAKDHNVHEPLMSGVNFTIPQIFYISFGQLWCEAPSKERSQKYILDVHSPNPLRVQGVVQNSRNFGKIFGCPAGSPMNPNRKCSLWLSSQDAPKSSMRKTYRKCYEKGKISCCSRCAA